MMWDKQKELTNLVSRRKPGGEKVFDAEPMKNEEVKTEDHQLDGRHLAAQEAIAAMREGSAEKLMNSLANFMDLHSSK